MVEYFYGQCAPDTNSYVEALSPIVNIFGNMTFKDVIEVK